MPTDIEEEEDEDDVWCIECGEDRRISYVETNAECDVWRCRTCGNEFQTPRHRDGEEK